MEVSAKKADPPFIPVSGLNTTEMSPNEQIYGCKICNNSFSSPIQSTIHYVTCHRLLPCSKCLLLFLSRRDLDEHNKHQHSNDDTNCSQCPMTLELDRSLVDHLHDVHQKKYCQMCSALVKSSAINTLQRHIEQVHKIPRQICGNDPIFSFDNLSTDQTFECLVCQQHFQIHRLFTHSLSFHKWSLGFIFANVLEKRYSSPVLKAIEDAENSAENYAKTLCAVCKCKFTPLAPKILHRIYCTGIRLCRRCCVEFNDDGEFDAHVGACDFAGSPDVDCCGFCADGAAGDQDHLSQVHCIDQGIYSEKTADLFTVQQTSWIASSYMCNFCKEDLSANIQKIENLIKHFVIHHKFSQNCILRLLEKSTVNLARDDTKKRKMPFQEVDATNTEIIGGGVVFDFDSKMVKVIYSSATDSDSSGSEETAQSRSTSPVYVCTFCSFKTAVKCMLATHLGQKHGFIPKIEDNRCNACKKAFTTHANLQRHYKNVHHKGNANQYKCPFCSISMKGKQKMRYAE